MYIHTCIAGSKTLQTWSNLKPSGILSSSARASACPRRSPAPRARVRSEPEEMVSHSGSYLQEKTRPSKGFVVQKPYQDQKRIMSLVQTFCFIWSPSQVTEGTQAQVVQVHPRVHICIYRCVSCIDIYIYGVRERHKFVCTCIYICIHICIYVTYACTYAYL